MLTRLTTTALALLIPCSGYAGWATSVESVDFGAGGNPGYTDPNAVLGPVDPITGELLGFAGPVTFFNAPFDADELISLGVGGQVTVGFATPQADKPGDDFIIYGNAGFIDVDWPNGQLGAPAGMFGNDGDTSLVEVSLDGVVFHALTGLVDSLFPTHPGTFGQPMDPSLTLADFDGLTGAQAAALYNGSAGGTAFDITGTPLSAFQYVRVSYTAASGDGNLEIDAFATTIPEPSILPLLAVGVAVLFLRRKC